MPIKNPSATQLGGVNASLVGLDTLAVYDAAPTQFAVDTNLTTAHIAGTFTGVEDPRYAGKALQIKAITDETANDALVNGDPGWYNRTGVTVSAGKYIVAVAA